MPASEVAQIAQMCTAWNNSSLCAQAFFCSSGDQCHTVGQIVADDYNLVERALGHVADGCVELQGGYQASVGEAEEDLRELRVAFAAINIGMALYNKQASCDQSRDIGIVELVVGGGLFGGLAFRTAAGALAELGEAGGELGQSIGGGLHAAQQGAASGGFFAVGSASTTTPGC